MIDNTTSRSRSPRGFTIIEVMMSVFILAVGLVALSSMQILGMQGNAIGEERGNAAAIVYAKLNELMSLNFVQDSTSGALTVDDRLADTEGEWTNAINVNRSGLTKEQISLEFPSGAGDDKEQFRYSLRWRIDDCADTNCNDGEMQQIGSWKRISVQVRWTDRSAPGGSAIQDISVNNVPMLPRYTAALNR